MIDPYYLFMAEAENQLPDCRWEVLAKCRKDFQKIAERGENPNNYISSVLAKYNMIPSQLSDREIEYLNATTFY